MGSYLGAARSRYCSTDGGATAILMRDALPRSPLTSSDDAVSKMACKFDLGWLAGQVGLEPAEEAGEEVALVVALADAMALAGVDDQLGGDVALAESAIEGVALVDGDAVVLFAME